jgi:hypothetical protein
MKILNARVDPRQSQLPADVDPKSEQAREILRAGASRKMVRELQRLCCSLLYTNQCYTDPSALL